MVRLHIFLTLSSEEVGEMLNSIYNCVCKQKECLELLIESHKLLSEQETDKVRKEEEREIIQGVKGLAKYLGCGINKAQDILNSGLLQSMEIAYRAGSRWIINATRLDEAISEGPNLLKSLPKVA